MAALDQKPGKPPKPTLAGQLEAQLRDRILQGDLAPEARLNLDRLREDMQVSVSSLREAVTRLVSDGLIEVAPQRGYRVAPISLENLAEITLMRTQLEPLALNLAVQNGGLDWETGVMAALYRLDHTRRCVDDPASIEAWEDAHNRFHRALIARCDMPLLLRTITMLQTMNDRYRRIFLKTRIEQRDLTAEHGAIAEAATTRRAADACDLLRAHLAQTGASLQTLLSDHLPKTAP